MKKILGLDLGTTSIGWAIVNEAEKNEEKSSIEKIGVRVNPLSTDEQNNFEKGKPITTNANRSSKRSMRRNLQRYKLRRNTLVEILKRENWISDETILAEQGNFTTFQTLRLRAKAANSEVTLEELARILLMINKKRGYKSNRKLNNPDEGQLIDNIDVAKYLHEHNMTPGEYAWNLLRDNNFNIPEFYKSDLTSEFDRIWTKQGEYYRDILSDELKDALKDKNEKQTWVICKEPFQIVGIKRATKGKELIKENYRWRADALHRQMDLEELAVVLQKINGQIKNASGYLGNISDRSKELYFCNETVGQYLIKQLEANPNISLKNQVFYRQDYIEEFDRIWSVQAKFHPELSDSLKDEIRNHVIFYQRPLRSQKGLVSICELEQWEASITKDGKTKIKTIGPKVCPKSSPLFQEFKIWQNLNNLKVNGEYLKQEDKEKLAAELSIKSEMTKTEVLKLLYENADKLDLNFKKIEGNGTQAALFKAYEKIIERSGHGEYNFAKLPTDKTLKIVSDVFSALGFNTSILTFRSDIEADSLEQQPMFRLWHLLYSYEGDNSKSGNEKLVKKISGLYGFDTEYAKIIAEVTFEPDYGNLSSRAIRKILPFMKEGNDYSTACSYAGYRHSRRSLTKNEIETKTYKDHLSPIVKNSLRNPVVEKILNQMVNVVNSVIDTYGKPDEVRIELARDLKKSRQEREEATAAISKSNADNDRIENILKDEFGIQHPSRNDITRYKLYEELAKNGYKTLYSDTYIPKGKLFSKEFDIEHIIPRAKLFDDSLSNKTLESKQINIDKGNKTAFDFVTEKYGNEAAEQYKAKIENLCKNGVIGKTKGKKLLMKEKEIPDGFIDRDLRDSQYIAKKAKEMLEGIVKSVVSTTGSVTSRLREDWQLVDIMKELNWDKYNKQGLTETLKEGEDGQIKTIIKDWTKRNDHRHHAMDALTIAFTRRCYIQYLNNLNARIPKSAYDETYIDLSHYKLNDIPKEDRSKVVRYIETKYMYRDKNGHLRFIPPIPLDVFRAQAKLHLENILVSIKAKNKVVTRNVNVTRKKGSENRKVQLTPRGQLHNESIYGAITQYVAKEEKVGGTFDMQKIMTVASPVYRDALLDRLKAYGNDPKKAFTGKNSIDKNPVYLNDMHTAVVPSKVKTLSLETIYTIRKEVNPTNFENAKSIEKVIDCKIRKILLDRLNEYSGKAKEAFSNLDENPIWLNKEKGIRIKSVKIKGVNNAIPLHDKRDNTGSIIRDGHVGIPTDYVSTSNNHHVAIFIDTDGNLQERVVSFFDAVVAINAGDPVIDKEYNKDKGWTFLFSMKQNEYFVFPNPETGFNPNDIDLTDPKNYPLISPNLFRVQKFTTKDYVFRHHLETKIEDKVELKGITWKRITMLNKLKGIVKVRINHLGQIVQVGEY